MPAVSRKDRTMPTTTIDAPAETSVTEDAPSEGTPDVPADPFAEITYTPAPNTRPSKDFEISPRVMKVVQEAFETKTPQYVVIDGWTAERQQTFNLHARAAGKKINGRVRISKVTIQKAGQPDVQAFKVTVSLKPAGATVTGPVATVQL